MKTPAFIFLFGAAIGLYLFGDSFSIFANLPADASALKAPIKGMLAAASVFFLIIKARDLMKIGSGFLIITVGIAGLAGYYYEITKDQRVGQKLLATYLDSSVASGVSIQFNEVGKWIDPTILIGFYSDKQKTFIPKFRSIAVCNIQIPGAEQLLSKISDEEISKTKFYWAEKPESANKIYYAILAVLPKGQNWFYRSWAVDKKSAPAPEDLENARLHTDNGEYIDRECAAEPYKYHKKSFSARGIIQTEWDEKGDNPDSPAKYNDVYFDRYGKLLNGQVEAVFVYMVSKPEEFQKGFGKAGPLKCVGYYTYRQGRKDGPYEFYYPGRIAKAFVGQYENGFRVGTHKQFNPNGTLKKSWVSDNSDSQTSSLTR